MKCANFHLMLRHFIKGNSGLLAHAQRFWVLSRTLPAAFFLASPGRSSCPLLIGGQTESPSNRLRSSSEWTRYKVLIWLQDTHTRINKEIKLMPKSNSVTHFYVESYKTRRHFRTHLKVAIKCIGEFIWPPSFFLYLCFFFLFTLLS